MLGLIVLKSLGFSFVLIEDYLKFGYSESITH